MVETEFESRPVQHQSPLLPLLSCVFKVTIHGHSVCMLCRVPVEGAWRLSSSALQARSFICPGGAAFPNGRWSGRGLLPVIGTVCALLDRGVFLVPDQPNKLGVHPQADVLPGLLGDVTAASIEVAHEDEILKDRVCSCLLWALSSHTLMQNW